MPNIDYTSISSLQLTAKGNGGRKSVRLDNGTLITTVLNGDKLYIMKSVNDGATWSTLDSASVGVQDVAIATDGTYFWVARTLSRAIWVAVWTEDEWIGEIEVDSGYTSLAGISLVANKSKTEVHLAVSATTSAYKYHNIYYVKGYVTKGTGWINWDIPQQWTKENSSNTKALFPSVEVDKDDNPVIACFSWTEFSSGVYPRYTMQALSRRKTGFGQGVRYSTQYSTIYATGSNTELQYSPNMLFVPPEITGTPNGRLWVTWTGDKSESTTRHLWVNYSDNGGSTWGEPTKLYTAGSDKGADNPVLTASKDGKVSIIYSQQTAKNTYNVGRFDFVEGAWVEASPINTSNIEVESYPTAIVDFNISYDVPLVVNTEQNGTFFTGAWENNVRLNLTDDYAGKFKNPDSLLTYSFTMGDNIGTVTEKVNGVVVGTKENIQLNQPYTLSLTKTQWVSVPVGDRNVITLAVKGDEFNFYFDKRLPDDATLLETLKGLGEVKTYVQNSRSELANIINSKGGSASNTDSLMALVDSLKNLPTKRWVSGVYSGNISTSGVTLVNNLGFKPRTVVAYISYYVAATYYEIISTLSLEHSEIDGQVKEYASSSSSSVSGSIGTGESGLTISGNSVSYNEGKDRTGVIIKFIIFE